MRKSVATRLPKKIKILGKTFEIAYIPDMKDKDDGDDLYGEMHAREFRIDINSSKSREVQEHTLFHEAMHGALDVAGLSSLLDEKVEEAIITCFENAFAHTVNVYALSIDSDETPKV